MTQGFLVAIIVFLALINLGVLIFAVYQQSNLNKCENNPSPYCPMLQCPNPDTSPPTAGEPNCGFNAYRIDGNGNKVCSS